MKMKSEYLIIFNISIALLLLKHSSFQQNCLSMVHTRSTNIQQYGWWF